jgi:hypothetical protein
VYVADKSKRDIENLIDKFNPANNLPKEDVYFYKQFKVAVMLVDCTF